MGHYTRKRSGVKKRWFQSLSLFEACFFSVDVSVLLSKRQKCDILSKRSGEKTIVSNFVAV